MGNRAGAPKSQVQVVGLMASAGGHSAILKVLKGLPVGFKLPVVVMQHLGPQSQATAEIYREQAERDVEMVEMVEGGDCLKPGAVMVCPPPEGLVLVVDDNADLRDYLHRLLSPQWEVETAGDGESAWQMMRQLRPDMVLADVMMPGLDGFGLLKRIREDRDLRFTPVVLVTARAGEETAIQGLMAGADDYVAKPFSPRELVARVRAVVERAKGEAALRQSEELRRIALENGRMAT